MRIFNVSTAGVVAVVLLFGSVGSVSAIEPYDLSSVSLQYQREVRSTYIIQFQDSIAPSEVQGRANAIAARFQGRIRHTYTRAMSGFAIRMNSTAMARLLDEGDLGIARISRGVIMTVAQSSDNAAEPAKGKPGGNTGGGGGGKSSCDQTLGWNISTVTTMVQDDKACTVTGEPDYSTGANVPIVCVLDTGVADHTDLNNGPRYNRSSSSTDDDIFGHGTHVAGIIGAIAGNKLGVVGVAPGVRITSIKVLNDDGAGSDYDVISGIDLALSDTVNCNIINMSLGGPASTPLDDAVKNAATGADGIPSAECNETEPDGSGGENSLCLANVTPESNIIFTLAAGNSAKDIGDYSPARASVNSADNIFTIASFGPERKTNLPVWSAFSNFGIDGGPIGMVDFALPGGKILSTVPGDGYDTYNGTSMAAPHMAGLLVRYIVASGIEFSSTSRVDIPNSLLGTNGLVTRISGFGPFLSDEEDYIIAADN